MLKAVHSAASRLRRTRALSPLEPAWLTVEPAWNRMVERLTRRRGYAASINGQPMRLSYVYGTRFEKAGYEPIIHRALLEGLHAGSVVFDVGAHVGVLTIAAARQVSPGGRVLAFEPTRETARTLRQHIAMNGLERCVDVIEAAVCDHNGTSEFHSFGESMAASISRAALELSPEPVVSGGIASNVPAVTLDRVSEEWRLRPDLVKIDVEGAELLVLKGMSTLLSDPHVQLICEVHPHQLRAMGCSVEELESFVASASRKIEPLDEPNHTGIQHVRVVPA